MARSRSFPTDLFELPDFFEWDSDTQIILIGLVLSADDYGRGVAHSRLLARKLDKSIHLIEQALTTLEAHELLCCYQVDHRHYYALTCWQQWQTLHKPTPSKYPAPPSPQEHSATCDPFPGNAGEMPENMGKIGESSSEEEQEVETEARKRKEVEKEAPSKKVVTFPCAHANIVSTTKTLSQEAIHQKTQQVAHILQLPVSEALTRVVADYQVDPTLLLLGEADAAREWIENHHRNRKGQPMTPAFFRRWLSREQASIRSRQRSQDQDAAATVPRSSRTVLMQERAVSPPAENPYHAFVERRVQEVAAACVQQQRGAASL